MRKLWWIGVPAALALLVSGIVPACSGNVGGTGDLVDSGGGGPSDGASDGTGVGGADGGPVAPCPACKSKGVGQGGDPFDPNSNESSAVGTDPNGALVIDQKGSASQYNRFLWVADTNLPGVVKIDLDTLQIVARYRTGGNSTSRTTVNVLGEAFVGARTSGTQGKFGVTKVLPYGDKCPDTNNDGKITTSKGPDDVLAYGQDDCVAWHVETEGDIRGLAAEDIPGVNAGKDGCKGFKQGEFDAGVQPSKPSEHYLWIGGLHGKIYKLDAKTGNVLLKIKAPSPVYGMALSGDGKLWSANRLSFVDTTRCTDSATCDAAPTCTQSCTETACPATCDGAIKASYTNITGYGITVDFKKRVWLSSGATKRYDPSAPANQRLKLGPSTGGGGIAADADGWVWVSYNSKTVRIHGDTMQYIEIAAPNKGVAVDTKGRVFAIRNTGVHMITPGATLNQFQLQNDVITLKGFAYAYSDMTGVQTRLATDIAGWYQHQFDGCDKTDTAWKILNWDVDVPNGTAVIFHARSADTAADLAKAAWIPVTCIGPPGGKGQTPIPLGADKGKLIEIKINLNATGETATQKSVSSKVNSFSVDYSCAAAIN